VTLEEVLQAVAARVPYLDATTTPAADGWVSCAALVDDAPTLTALVRATKAGFGTDDDAVAASLFAEAYAFRAGGAALAAYALGLAVPATEPAYVAVRVDKPRPTAAAYLSPQLGPPDARALARSFVGSHMRALVTSLRDQFTIGERLLWGNVAAACAVVFRAVESSGVDREPVRERAVAFVDACAPWFADLGRFNVVRDGGREGWYWDRTNCCLWFRTTSGSYCDNCSLVDPDELHRRRVRELGDGPGEPPVQRSPN
jgi:ferric iron reductase protein FhuF